MAEPVSAELWIPGRLPGLNDLIFTKVRRGIRVRTEAVRRVILLAQTMRLPRFERARFVFTWVEPDKRRDPDGIAGGGRKVVLDGLVRAGVLPGDGWAHVVGWSDHFELDKAAPGARVRILSA